MQYSTPPPKKNNPWGTRFNLWHTRPSFHWGGQLVSRQHHFGLRIGIHTIGYSSMKKHSYRKLSYHGEGKTIMVLPNILVVCASWHLHPKWCKSKTYHFCNNENKIRECWDNIKEDEREGKWSVPRPPWQNLPPKLMPSGPTDTGRVQRNSICGNETWQQTILENRNPH